MFQRFFDLCQVTNTRIKFFQAILLKLKRHSIEIYLNLTRLNRRLFMKTICLWPNRKQLISLSQKNMLCPILPSQHLPEFSTSKKSHLQTCGREHKLKQVLFHDNLLMILLRLSEEIQSLVSKIYNLRQVQDG